MKFKYTGDDERVFPTLGITVQSNDEFDAPDDFVAVNVEPASGAKVAPTQGKTEKVAFNPNAKDGDKDGFVQDGTEHERPVTPKVKE